MNSDLRPGLLSPALPILTSYPLTLLSLHLSSSPPPFAVFLQLVEARIYAAMAL